MLNKLAAFVKKQALVTAGDRVICAVSGGADSMALLWGMYLLKDTLGITLAAAHFNHDLRGEESDRDEAFVRDFCQGYDIPFYSQKCRVTAGKKGLEAAAREARYSFFRSLEGKIATAHTADDNAETVLMHLVRGTGLRGLGGIAPSRGQLIRPMLEVTRGEVLDFLTEYSIPYVEDSSNHTDNYLRNRIRHHVMPLLKEENPVFAQKVSAMAMTLRQEEAFLSELTLTPQTDVETLRTMPEALRRRHLLAFLKSCGVPEPENSHVALTERLVFSAKPSGRVNLPGGVTLGRDYNRLVALSQGQTPEETPIAVPGVTELPQWGIRVTVTERASSAFTTDCFTVDRLDAPVIRSRRAGDEIRLSGGTRSLKKLFIDRKVSASERDRIPILADDSGVVAVAGIGVNLDRHPESGGLTVYIQAL